MAVIFKASSFVILLILYLHLSYAVPCERPSDYPHSQWKVDGITFPVASGESLEFKCDTGYIIENSQLNVLCDNGSWILPQNLCRPRSCGYPGDIENSKREGSLYTYPNSVNYSCYEGYKMNGVARIFCSTTGQWTPALPSCEIVVCPLLSNIEDGKVISNERNYNSRARYECNRHFRLEGNSERICQGDAMWSGSPPSCIAVTCLDPGPLVNGRVYPNRKEHKADDIVIFNCNKGGGTVTSKCLEDGSWSNRPPICEGGTTIKPKIKTEETTVMPTTTDSTVDKVEKCDDPGDIRNGKRHLVTGFSDDTNVTYYCEEGYELRGEGTLVCLPNGKWNLNKLPICVKPIPTGTIVGIVLGIALFSILLAFSCFMYFRWREKKLRGYGSKSKALTADATDLEEITGLEKGKKPIPVTVL